MKNPDLFVSYCHRDRGVARQLVGKLEDVGLRCYMAEKDIGAGEVWEENIREALYFSQRLLLLITPRSKNSLWVAAEAGAAWVLRKKLIAALMFVDTHELIEPIRRHQARVVETADEVDALVRELVSTGGSIVSGKEVSSITDFSDTAQEGVLDAAAQVEAVVPGLADTQWPLQQDISGQWMDPSLGDVAYFKGIGNKFVGFYDYGSGKRKVGVYIGSFRGRSFNYRWEWLDRGLRGHGEMSLSDDCNVLSGHWWYDSNKKDKEPLSYQRVSDQMPPWLRESDFNHYEHWVRDN